MEGGEDMNIDETLNSQELFSKDTGLKANYKSFEFILFGRTFKFETYLKHRDPANMFAPVEPCETSARLAAVFCKTPSPPYTDEDIMKYKNALADYDKMKDQIQ